MGLKELGRISSAAAMRALQFRETRDERPRWSQLVRVGLATLLLWAAITAPLRADSSDAQTQRIVARELGTAGMEAYFDGNYERAADNLDRAYRLFPTPTLGLWSGRAYIQLGQWVRAAERLREVQYASATVGDNAAQQKAQADALSELTSLEPRIPRLTVTIAGARATEVTLSVDEQPFEHELVGIAHPIDPGPHSVVGTFREQRVEVAVELAAGASEVAHLEFKPVAAPPLVVSATDTARPVPPRLATTSAPAESDKRWLRTAAIASIGVGGAALATSLITMLLARHELEGCEQRHGEYWCNDNEADAYEVYRGLATGTFYAGSALAVAGALLYVLQPSPDNQRRMIGSATPIAIDLTF